MQGHLSIWALVAHADWVVKFVLLVLLGLSIASWCIIFERIKAIKAANRALNDFQLDFWQASDLFSQEKRHPLNSPPLRKKAIIHTYVPFLVIP